MLISNQYRFIFVHVHKVGGQSLTNALMPFAAAGWQRAMNRVFPYRYQLKVFTKLRQKSRNRITFYPQPARDHIRGPELRELIGHETFDNYFSFAFVRNPWAWVYSNYIYARTNPRHWQHKFLQQFNHFEEFCEWQHASVKRPALQRDYIFDGQGKQILDFVGRQENMEKDFFTITQRLGIQAELPRLNVSAKDSYKKHYTPTTRQLVAEQFVEDIEAFGYTF